MTRGGKRPGAGRKPLAVTKTTVCVTLSPEVTQFLKSQPNQSQHVEETLRKSKAFREWRKQK